MSSFVLNLEKGPFGLYRCVDKRVTVKGGREGNPVFGSRSFYFNRPTEGKAHGHVGFYEIPGERFEMKIAPDPYHIVAAAIAITAAFFPNRQAPEVFKPSCEHGLT